MMGRSADAIARTDTLPPLASMPGSIGPALSRPNTHEVLVDEERNANQRVAAGRMPDCCT